MASTLARYERELDLILAADVLVYVGADLAPLFKAAHRSLRENGHFAFSTEQLLAADEGDERTQPCRLNATGRYSHRESHVIHESLGAGFQLLKTTNCIGRREAGAPVVTQLYVLRKGSVDGTTPGGSGHGHKPGVCTSARAGE